MWLTNLAARSPLVLLVLYVTGKQCSYFFCNSSIYIILYGLLIARLSVIVSMKCHLTGKVCFWPHATLLTAPVYRNAMLVKKVIEYPA